MATVHPHKGYLNTTFHFFAKGSEDVEYCIFPNNNEDTNPVISGTFSPGIPHFVKLQKSGSFRIAFNDGTSAIIIVEDGYKFGGSEYKDSFIFDSCPWIFIIMHDRTYFYNRENDESYVESISPDSIEEISKDYVIFGNSEHPERTVYSLVEQKPVLCISNLIYYNDEIIIWGEDDCILIYSFNDDGIVSQITPIKYLIDKENNRLLYSEGQSVFTFDLFGDYQITELYEYEGHFNTFIDNEISVYSSNENGTHRLNIINHTTGKLLKTLVIEGFISSINGDIFIDLDQRNRNIQDLDLDQAGIPEATIRVCYHDFIFYHCEWDIYYLERISVFTKLSTYFAKDVSINLYSLNTDLCQTFNTLENKAIITDNRFLLFNDHESFVRSKYYNAAGYRKNGRVYVHKDIIILSTGEYFYRLSNNGYWDNQKKCDFTFDEFENYGLIFNKKDNEYQSFKHYIKGDYIRHFYDLVDYVILGNSIITASGNVYFDKNDFPVYSMELSAVSNNLNWAIFVDTHEGKILLYSFEEGNEITREILCDKFDKSKYLKVLIDSSGTRILYRSSNNTEIMDVETGEVVTFDNLSYVEQCNGIRPIFHRSGSLQPRIINPVTGQPIDGDLMKQFNFMSPNGKLYADTRISQYTERYYIESKRIIANEEYVKLYKSLTFPSRNKRHTEEWQEVKNRRVEFIKEHFDYLNKNYHRLLHDDPTGEKWDKSLIGEQSGLDTSVFIGRVIREQGIAIIRDTSKNTVVARINLGFPISFLNYVSFSHDSRFVSIAGYSNSYNGLFLIYDLKEKKILCRINTRRAVWTTAFSIKGHVAAYTSQPDTIYFENDYSCDSRIDFNRHLINGRNFLTFSPDGSFIALSNQGYIPHNNTDSWGHQPSTLVELRHSSNIARAIVSFTDLSSSGVADTSTSCSVASVSFSNDNKRLMMVGNDGVVIIRNLYLDKYAGE